ncbi:histidine kinase [Actinophytocola oryzae]|uniref:Histidine kinase n=1 Tax=Actinophytocola oryzae TaxID=502181 RepID=A0A4R7V7P3_9PSEU|nr:histidine kinase [Actinophytocola oryzae]TDV44937.1 histidine kinase [Actinophytocola oryzae]
MRLDLERTLHDGAAADMSALALELGLISMAADDPTTGARIEAALDMLRRAIDDLRGIGSALYPPVLVSAGLGPALTAVAERRELRLRLDLPRRELGVEARSRTGLLVVDHLRTLCPGSSVRVRVRGARFVRVHITDAQPDRSTRHHRAVFRCA